MGPHEKRANRMRTTTAHIDLDALVWNLGVVRRRADGHRLLAMVKANAYGHGMIPVSRALARHGVDALGVAFVDEAVELRRAGIATPILILTPAAAHDADAVVDYAVESVACDLEQVRALDAAAQRAGTTAAIHVYVDTGMHREGLRPRDVDAFVDAVDAMAGIRAVGICTHFATSDEPGSVFLREQYQCFADVVGHLAHRGRTFDVVHVANSGAISQFEAIPGSMVRPGLSLYGYPATDDIAMNVRPVMSVHSEVLSFRRVHAGESVSYGRRWIAPETTTIVTIPIGYGDGYMRRLTGRASMIFRGRRVPVVGTICMDECMVDVGDVAVAIGEPVVILGSQAAADGTVTSIDATDIARWAETIPYDVTSALLPRLHRRYSGNDADVVSHTEEHHV